MFHLSIFSVISYLEYVLLLKITLKESDAENSGSDQEDESNDPKTPPPSPVSGKSSDDESDSCSSDDDQTLLYWFKLLFCHLFSEP